MSTLRRLGRIPAALLVALALVLTAARSDAADPQPYQVEIQETGKEQLDEALEAASLLVDLREKAPVGPFALIGRARGDEERLQTVLQGLGYYEGEVDITIDGRPLDDPELPDHLAGLPAEPPVPVTVSIREGPQFQLGEVTLEGQVPEAARARLDLAPGAPAVAADVLAARERLLAALRREGHALARVGEPIAILDLEANALDVTFQVDAGPRVDIGPISFQGLEKVEEPFLRERLLLHPGQPYDPRAIEKARQDLAALGVFSSVVAVPATELDPDGRLPIEFIVTERKRRVVTFTAEYATDVGASVSTTWRHRNLLGAAEQLKLSAGFSAGGTAQTGPGYWGSVQFIKPDFLARDQTLQVEVSPLKESLTAYDRLALTGTLSLTRKLSERWTGSVGVGAERERVTQQDIEQSYTLVSLPIAAKYDSTNDLFNPTRGVRAALSATPFHSIGDQKTNFVVLQAAGSTYLDASGWVGADPGRTVVALRGLVGDIRGASQFQIPADKRFYAGGSATVRGYKFQTVGPLFPDDQPQGGTGVIVGTVELRQRILEDYGAVAFVDAGQVVANEWSLDGPWGIGAGVGARYYTAVGPIRVDVAVPLNELPDSGSFQLYIGIGQAF